MRRRKPFGLIGLSRDDRRQLPWQRPARGLGGGPDRLGVGRGFLHEQLQQPPPAALDSPAASDCASAKPAADSAEISSM